MKPRLKWFSRFDELKHLPDNTRLYAGKRKFRLEHVFGAENEHPKRLALMELIGNKATPVQVRLGDALIFELTDKRPD